MKVKVNQKQIKENYQNIICVGYCDLCYLLKTKDPNFYTSGIYGWNADIYQIDYNTVIVTGYRPFGNITSNVTGLNSKYNEKARKIYTSNIDYDKICEKLDKLLKEYISDMLKTA